MGMRTNERLSLEIPASVKAVNEQEGDPMALVTADVSSGGAFFHTDQPMSIGTKVVVEIVIPIEQFRKIETDKVLYAVAGTVVRSDRKGMAVCFEKESKISPLER